MMKDKPNEQRFVPTCNAETDFVLSFKGGKEYITFRNGKSYPLSLAKFYQRKTQLRMLIRKEQTKRALWKRTHFLSRDDESSAGYNADMSDCGASVRRMVFDIDRPTRRRLTPDERNRAIINAAIYVAKALGYKYRSPDYYEILTFISTVALYPKDARAVLRKRLKLTYNAYMIRLRKYIKLLERRPK